MTSFARIFRAAARRASSPLPGVAVSALAFAALALASGCGRKSTAAAKPAGPVEVGVVTLAPTAVTLTQELPGRISAFRVAEVRARVNGIVVKRLFTEGSEVREGQPLFKKSIRRPTRPPSTARGRSSPAPRPASPPRSSWPSATPSSSPPTR